ncbi:MAG: acetate--CoA ligase family protein [Halofilum sp. (in: g-proteobacteria)]|nr:acetate--CoA ligase family protein [Halofilum sp. (in: g-proteobacteria)]
MGFPVAVKIESPDVTHKTDLGGVRLGIGDEAGARAAFASIMETVGGRQPGAALAGVLVQAMDREDAVELVIGLEHDPVFGMMLMLGMGGIALEVSPDVAFRKAPVSEAEAARMIAGLRGADLLGPVRGRPAIDTAAVARLAAAVSAFGAAHADRVRELDLNPVRATPSGARVVDWLLLTADGGGGG